VDGEIVGLEVWVGSGDGEWGKCVERDVCGGLGLGKEGLGVGKAVRD
jgi:hypothetical protein